MLHTNILLVDDEETLCRGCKRILDAEGFKTETALTGEAGLTKALSGSYDVVITDLKMPDISGIDIIREIKQSRPAIPIIMITGYASVNTAVEAMKLGADDYIPKPFEPDEIIGAVRNVLAKAYRDASQVPELTPQQKIIDRQQVMEVLSRTASDGTFWSALMSDSAEALKQYNLSLEARAAIMSGDIKWVRENVGRLSDAQLTFLMHRLQREVW